MKDRSNDPSHDTHALMHVWCKRLYFVLSCLIDDLYNIKKNITINCFRYNYLRNSNIDQFNICNDIYFSIFVMTFIFQYLIIRVPTNLYDKLNNNNNNNNNNSLYQFNFKLFCRYSTHLFNYFTKLTKDTIHFINSLIGT